MGDLPRLGQLPVSNSKSSLGLVRIVRALAVAKGDLLSALSFAAAQWPTDEPVRLFLKAAVTAATTTDSDWAEPLVARPVLSEFIEASRASSILLRLAAVRRLPFGIRVPRVLSGTTVGWVGEGASKPVGQMSLDDITMAAHKVSGIVVISLDLARSSSPSAEAVIRADMISACNSLVDSTFTGTAAGSATTPAGILNGVTPVASTGGSAAAIASDVADVIGGMLTAGGQAVQLIVLAHPSTASLVGLTFGGAGASFSLPILTSSAVTAGRLIVLDQSELLVSDDETVSIDGSQEASVQFNSTPATPATPLVSLWQQNLFGLRAERTVNWAPKRTAAATAGYVSGL